MLPRDNRRCLHATWLAFSVAWCGVATAANQVARHEISEGSPNAPQQADSENPPPHAPPTGPVDVPAKAGPKPAEPPSIGESDRGPSEPDVSACVDGFLAARDWVTSLAPPDTEGDASRLTLPGVRGVSIILRHEGRIVGTGDDWPGLAGDDRMLRRAVGRAVGRALGDRVIAALPESERTTAGKQLAIEMEFAGRPEPLLGRTLADCALRIEPGLDGIAIRRAGNGKPAWAVAYPSRLQATNTAGTPDRTFVSLLIDLGLPAKDLPELARIEPVGVFRFSSLRLAQADPGKSPNVRGRGTARVQDADVTRERIVDHARQILARLEASMPARAGQGGEAMEGIGLVGDYRPVRDDFKPFIAPPADQALVAWAAAAFAQSQFVPEADRANARALAIHLLENLAIQNPSEEPPTAATPPLAYALCAIAALGGTADLDDGGTDLARIAREKLAVALQSGSSNDRVLAGLAAAATLGTELRFVPAADVRRQLDVAWDGIPREQLVVHFPWLILAESHYARATGQAAARATDARGITQLLFLVQAGFGELTAQQDLRGGFRLAAGRRGGVTSQCLRPGLGLAAMLAYPGFLTEDSTPLYRERLLALVRFAMELTIDESQAPFYRNAKRALGGIRAALWDSDQPVAASALAVLVDVIALEAGLGSMEWANADAASPPRQTEPPMEDPAASPNSSGVHRPDAAAPPGGPKESPPRDQPGSPEVSSGE